MGSSCYYIPQLTAEDRQFTWWDARFLCKEHLGPAADLIAIETRTEMNQLINLLTNHYGGKLLVAQPFIVLWKSLP